MHQVLKERSDIHLSRKLTHATSIGLMALVYNLYGARPCWWILIPISLFIVPLDFLRQRQPGLNRATQKVFGPVMRKHEANNLSGMSYLYFGCYFLLFLNEKHVVTLTLLFLALGDPIASFFGLRYGKDKILGNKTLQGTMASFVTCTTIAALYYYFNNIMTERLLIVAPISGLIGAIAELVPVGKLDDNFTIPVIAACLLWLLFKVYGGFAL